MNLSKKMTTHWALSPTFMAISWLLILHLFRLSTNNIPETNQYIKLKFLTYLLNLNPFMNKMAKCQQHPVFPGGLPSKYWRSSMLLNFGDRTRTGVFSMIWPLTRALGEISFYEYSNPSFYSVFHYAVFHYAVFYYVVFRPCSKRFVYHGFVV